MKAMHETEAQVESKRCFWLERRLGDRIRAKIPPSYTVGQAAPVLAAKAGFDNELDSEHASIRIAVKAGDGWKLVPDDTRFSEIEEESVLRVIPSLVPAF